MRLFIARHAETVPNMNGISVDQTMHNVLTDLGRAQAGMLAKHLRERSIDYIYASDILRTLATAYVISDAMPEITLMLTKDLRAKDSKESAAAFEVRISNFVRGLRQKYDKHNVLLITHSDVISQIRSALVGKPAEVDLASITELLLGPNEEIREATINFTEHLN
ncbi:MAG: histidine phosphatase family protein [Patescibacteria group bacterium]